MIREVEGKIHRRWSGQTYSLLTATSTRVVWYVRLSATLHDAPFNRLKSFTMHDRIEAAPDEDVIPSATRIPTGASGLATRATHLRHRLSLLKDAGKGTNSASPACAKQNPFFFSTSTISIATAAVQPEKGEKRKNKH